MAKSRSRPTASLRKRRSENRLGYVAGAVTTVGGAAGQYLWSNKKKIAKYAVQKWKEYTKKKSNEKKKQSKKTLIKPSANGTWTRSYSKLKYRPNPGYLTNKKQRIQIFKKDLSLQFY